MAFWVPFAFRAYWLVAVVLSLAIVRPPILPVMSPAQLGVARYLHPATLWRWLLTSRL